MTTNVNSTAVKAPDKVDWNYEGGAKPLPPGGKGHEYALRTSKVTLDRTADGYLRAIIDAKVVAPNTPYDGFETRFNRVSTKNWPGKPINAAAEYLKACGAKVTPQDDAAYTAALTASVNAQFRATLDWEAYDKELGVNVKGMGAFPLNTKNPQGVLAAPKLAEGSPLPFVMAGPKSDQKVYANVRIKFFNTK